MYLLLYLVPDELISENATLRAQKQYLRSYFEKTVVRAFLGEGLGEVPLFERVLSGLINLEGNGGSVLERIAPQWYVFMKRSYASTGPRIGNFTEYLIGLWIGADHVNYNLDKFLEERFGANINRPKRSKIDFIRVGNALDLIELRTSEHTGGRTGQESLTDKFVRFLGMLEEPGIELRKALMGNNINRANLLVVTLFNESGELLSAENFNRGRLNSLVGYLSEERHLGGKVRELLERGYTLYAGNTAFEEPPEDIETVLRKSFLEERRLELKKDGFTVEIGILFGDEFFERFTGRSLAELLKGDIGGRVGDDLWMFLVLTLNELRLRAEGETSTVDLLRDYIRRHGSLRRLLELRETSTSLEDFLNEFGKLVDSTIPGFLRECEEMGRKLRPLGTDDIVAQYNYLRGALLVAFAIELYLKG